MSTSMYALTADEREQGWVEHHCDEHGFLAACAPSALVTCACGKVARMLRSGRIVNEETLKPTAAKPRARNGAGQAFIHGCGDCGEDFGGETLLRRHRAGGKRKKRCMSRHEMIGRGWFADEAGRWRVPGSKSPSRQSGSTVFETVEAILSPEKASRDTQTAEPHGDSTSNPVGPGFPGCGFSRQGEPSAGC